MKRFTIICSILLLISFYCNATNAFAETKALTQGIYSVKDSNFLVGTPINVTITPSNSKAIIIVIDSDQIIESIVRLNPQITKQTLPPLNYNSSIIIFTNGSVVFS